MKRNRLTAFLLALVLSVSLGVPALAEGDFPDVAGAEWDWAREAIRTCAEAGTVKGFEDGSFRPDEPVTSAQFIVMLTRTFYGSEVNAAQSTAGQPWYAPNVTVANNHDMLIRVSEVSGNAISRYEMAEALYNVIFDHGKGYVDEDDLAEASTKIKDYLSDDFAINHINAVLSCYALGILSGMSDGAFHGEQTMTRAQACVVITRMIALLDGETPVQPDTPAQPQQPEPPAQPQQPEPPAQTETEKLTNGKDITVENVQELLAEIQEQYPAGTAWGAYEPRYVTENKNSTNALTLAFKGEKDSTSGQVGCGGFAVMVSDKLFGNNATRNLVDDISEVRPGDIVGRYNADGTIDHAAIVLYTEAPGVGDNASKIAWHVHLGDAGGNGGKVNYSAHYAVNGCGKENASKNGEYYKFVTRYPE